MRSGSPPVTGTAGWVAAGSPCARVGHAQRCDHLIGRVRPHARGTDQTTARTHGYSPGGWACRGNRSGPQRWAGQQPGTTVTSTPTDLRGHTGAHRRDGLPPTVLRHMLPVDHGRGPYRTASRIHRGIPKSSPNTAAARVSVETTTSSAAVAHDFALRVRGRSTHPFSALGPCWMAGDQRAGPTGHRRGVALPGHANHSSIHCGPC